MNQDQRRFLIDQVEKTCKEQVEKLEEKVPEKPSLNNYLVAAFLDNSIQFADIDALKKKMREMVLRFGSDEQLIKKGDHWSRKKKEDDEDEIVEIPAQDIFIIPEAYKKALKEYEDRKAEIEKEIEKLEHISRTIVLKLQIGSSAALDKIVMQVDNIGDLSIMNNQLLIGRDKDAA